MSYLNKLLTLVILSVLGMKAAHSEQLLYLKCVGSGYRMHTFKDGNPNQESRRLDVTIRIDEVKKEFMIIDGGIISLEKMKIYKAYQMSESEFWLFHQTFPPSNLMEAGSADLKINRLTRRLSFGQTLIYREQPGMRSTGVQNVDEGECQKLDNVTPPKAQF